MFFLRFNRVFSLVGALGLLLAACSAPTATPVTPAPGAESTIPVPATSAPAAVPTPDGPVIITFGIYEFKRAAYEPLVERFNAENTDMRVQLVSIDGMIGPNPTGAGWMRSLASAADTFFTYELNEPDAVRQGYVRDLAPFIAADAGFAAADYYPGAMPVQADGTLTLLPTGLYLPIMAYNRDLWAALGLTPPQPDWTWADLRAALAQLAGQSDATEQTYGLMQSTRQAVVRNPDLTGEYGLFTALVSGAARLDDPESIAALERIAAQFQRGEVYTPPEYSDGSFLYASDYMPLIMNQQLGMWMLSDLEYDGLQRVPFAVGYAAPPASTTPTPTLTVYREGLAMSGGTRYPDQAWRWLTYISAQDTLLDQPISTLIPPRRSLAEAGPYWENLDAEGQAAVAAILAQLPNVAAPSATPMLSATLRQNQVTQALNTALAAILDEDVAVAQAAQAAQSELDAQPASVAVAVTPTPDPNPVVVATPPPAPTALAEAVHITFITSPWSEAATRRVAERFNEQFPQYAVTLAQFPFPADGIVRFADLAADADCFGGWSPPANAADRAAVLDVQPLLDADATFPRDDYPTALLDLFRYAGGLYGLPDGLTTRVLFYNQELFDAAGVAYPNADWTMDDFAAAAEALTGGDATDRQYGFAAIHADDLLFYLARTGAAPYRVSGAEFTPDFTNPAVEAAIREYVQLLAAVAPETRLNNYDQNSGSNEPYQLVNEGRVAMWLSSGIGTSHLGETLPFTIGIAPIPLREQPLSSADLVSEGLFISADTANPAACWAWLRFLSDDAGRFVFTLPARASLAQAPAFLEQAPVGVAAIYPAYSAALERGFAPTIPLPRDSVNYYWLQRAVDRFMQGEPLETELADAQFFAEQFQACVQSGERSGACLSQADPTYNGWQQ